jgi:uncharacterized protein Yka (UPF0111/DUF47 family)
MKHQNILDRIFPPKFTFYDQLEGISQINNHSLSTLKRWLADGLLNESHEMDAYPDKMNQVKLALEKDLVKAFSTPFDREDIYQLSIKMNHVFNYTISTYLSIWHFKVVPDAIIIEMVEQLGTGLAFFSEAVKVLKTSPGSAEEKIPQMREACQAVETLYIKGMSARFKSGDAMEALKFKEIYHHIKDASSYLNASIDTLHKIIVGLS